MKKMILEDDMNTKRVDISILRIMATLAVIFLHTNNTILNNTQNYQLSSGNKFLMSVNISIMNWAVPMFLIITGALFNGIKIYKTNHYSIIFIWYTICYYGIIYGYKATIC